ncbi:MAG TPA: ATP-binding protein [Methylomirabilota bacterium]|nr:ATP-binding protein [Methylomirabilota bacterium]
MTGSGARWPGASIDNEAFLAALPDAVVGVDSGFTITLWNQAAEVMVGRSARRMLGRQLKEAFPPDSSLVRNLTETLRSAESRAEGEARVESADGRSIPVSLVTAPLVGRSGHVTGAVAVLRDLSRLKQLEEEVQRGERLALVGRTAVSLAHEIRNPLGAIRGAVQLLNKELGEGSQWQEYTTVLVKEVDRVNRIIESLLDLGRPVQLRLQSLNLHQLLEQVALLSEEMARQRRVTIIRRYDPSLPPIHVDEDRMLQLFHNLVRNAIEAMPRGGRLTLTSRLSMNPLFAKVDLGGGARVMVEVQVADEGEGIPDATREQIFDPFFTTKTQGLGLGLALCHRIIEEHKGAIHVESEPGRGTTVTCFLPVQR